MSDFDELIEEGLYYIFSSLNPNYSLSIQNNKVYPYAPLTFSYFQDSFCQAFYFSKNKDNSYLIMNINSLKIIGVNNIYNNSPIIQNIISPSNNYKWEIVRTNNYNLKEYYIELKYNYKKRLDCLNNFAFVNDKNDLSQSQRFMFRYCLYNVPKSNLWQKWERYHCREFLMNNAYVIRSAENDNEVLNLDLLNNNITLNYFTGNKEQIFFILKVQNNFIMAPINIMNLMKNGLTSVTNILGLKNSLKMIEIKDDLFDFYGNRLYRISSANSNIYPNYNLFQFNYNTNLPQKVYFSRVTCFIFKKYILQTLNNYCYGDRINFKYKYILDYDLDGIINLNCISIDKNTKYISDNVFKNFKNLTMIKINIEWINKFNTYNIISLELNDNISSLDLNLLKSLKNLNELHLPLSIIKIIGSYTLNIPNLKKLECDPKLLRYFEGINLEVLMVHKDIKQISFNQNFYPFENINSKILILFENLVKIQQGIFDYSSLNDIICCVHHVKYLNKNNVNSIFVKDDNEDTIYSNTFENFINLKVVILSKNIRKIESKGFNNCKNLLHVKLPENCINIIWDSFFKCDKLEIECKSEIKTKLEQIGTINKKSITKKDLENYTSVEGLEINFDAKVQGNSLKYLTDLKTIKCNPEILNKLPLNKYNENNITALVIQNGTKQLTKEMFKYCLNLEYISIPLSVEKNRRRRF